MSSYAVILEMRKKKIGFIVHLIHFILTMMTLIWGLVWVVHCLAVSSHNSKIDDQIEKVMKAEAYDARKS